MLFNYMMVGGLRGKLQSSKTNNWRWWSHHNIRNFSYACWDGLFALILHTLVPSCSWQISKNLLMVLVGQLQYGPKNQNTIEGMLHGSWEINSLEHFTPPLECLITQLLLLLCTTRISHACMKQCAYAQMLSLSILLVSCLFKSHPCYKDIQYFIIL